MNDFLQNASAFNCGLISLKNLMWVECHPRGFNGNNRIILIRRQLFVDKKNAFD